MNDLSNKLEIMNTVNRFEHERENTFSKIFKKKKVTSNFYLQSPYILLLRTWHKNHQSKERLCDLEDVQYYGECSALCRDTINTMGHTINTMGRYHQYYGRIPSILRMGYKPLQIFLHLLQVFSNHSKVVAKLSQYLSKPFQTVPNREHSPK